MTDRYDLYEIIRQLADSNDANVSGNSGLSRIRKTSADVDTLVSRLTAARASRIDNLASQASVNNLATQSSVNTIDTVVDAIKALLDTDNTEPVAIDGSIGGQIAYLAASASGGSLNGPFFAVSGEAGLISINPSYRTWRAVRGVGLSSSPLNLAYDDATQTFYYLLFRTSGANRVVDFYSFSADNGDDPVLLREGLFIGGTNDSIAGLTVGGGYLYYSITSSNAGASDPINRIPTSNIATGTVETVTNPVLGTSRDSLTYVDSDTLYYTAGGLLVSVDISDGTTSILNSLSVGGSVQISYYNGRVWGISNSAHRIFMFSLPYGVDKASRVEYVFSETDSMPSES